MNVQHRIIISVISVLTVILIGTLGYAVIEDWSFADSFYMTMITISTVGFGEVREMSQGGRFITVMVIISSITVGGYALTTITSYIVSGEAVHRFRTRRMKRKIRAMENHIILAGYGKLGREIASELSDMKTQFCVIELDEAKANEARELGLFVIEGDASHDDVLEDAGVKRARGLIAALTGDPANVMVTISARELNPEIYIVARGIDEHSRAKLHRAGADRVELPFRISGRRISTLMVKPDFVDFVDLFSRTFSDDLHMTQMEVTPDSLLVDRSLKGLDIRRATGGLMIMAIQHEDGELVVQPDGDARIHLNDRLLVLGKDEQIHRFQKEFKVTEALVHSHQPKRAETTPTHSEGEGS